MLTHEIWLEPPERQNAHGSGAHKTRPTTVSVIRKARRLFHPFAILAIVLISACNRPVGPQADQTSLRAWIDKPLHQSTHYLGPLEVLAHGSAYTDLDQLELSFAPKPDGQMTLVGTKPPAVLYEEAASNGSANSILGRVSWTWTPPTAGDYTLFVRARDPQGSWSEYAQAEVSILLPDLPVGGLTEPEPPDQAPQIAPTFTVTPTTTPTATATPTATPTSPPAQLASSPPSTGQVFFGGSSCSPQSVTFQTQASHPSGVNTVVFFYRLIDQSSGEQSAWSNGNAMSSNGDGSYSLTLTGDQLARPAAYSGNNATVRYQFALQPVQGEIMRSPVYSDLVLSRCITVIIPGPIYTSTPTVR